MPPFSKVPGSSASRRLRRRLALAPVMVDRGDDVLGPHGFAVMELDPLAQREGPLRGVVRGRPALRQFRHQLSGVVHLGQMVAEPVAEQDDAAVLESAGIERVGRAAMGAAEAPLAALLRRRSRSWRRSRS